MAGHANRNWTNSLSSCPAPGSLRALTLRCRAASWTLESSTKFPDTANVISSVGKFSTLSKGWTTQISELYKNQCFSTWCYLWGQPWGTNSHSPGCSIAEEMVMLLASSPSCFSKTGSRVSWYRGPSCDMSSARQKVHFLRPFWKKMQTSHIWCIIVFTRL